jgi:hypothetical protein
MEPAQRQALERKRSKRFYKPLFQIRKPGDAVGVFFILAGCAALGAGVNTAKQSGAASRTARVVRPITTDIGSSGRGSKTKTPPMLGADRQLGNDESGLLLEGVGEGEQ